MVSVVIQESDIVPLDNFEHVLHVNDEEKHVNKDDNAGNCHDVELGVERGGHLNTAIGVHASVLFFLVLGQEVDVIFPDPGHIFLWASQILNFLREC